MKRKQRVCIVISVGPITHLGLTETLRREIERLQPHLGEIEIPIGETDLPRDCGSGYASELGGARQKESVGRS